MASVEVLRPLSDEEIAVLELSHQGNSMMPIGRWEKSVERLVRLGYLRAFDRFNNEITDQGRYALEQARENTDAQLTLAVSQITKLGQEYAVKKREICGLLVSIIRVTATVTGSSIQEAADNVLSEVLKVVREKLE